MVVGELLMHAFSNTPRVLISRITSGLYMTGIRAMMDVIKGVLRR